MAAKKTKETEPEAQPEAASGDAEVTEEGSASETPEQDTTESVGASGDNLAGLSHGEAQLAKDAKAFDTETSEDA